MKTVELAPASAPRRRPVRFAAFVELWNAGQGQATPDLHLRVADWLDGGWQRRAEKRLLLAFRGAGKSTLTGLYCAWLLLIRPDLRILVLAADDALARKMVRNVKRVIERHPLTGHLRPVDADQWAADRFTVDRPGEFRDPSVLARGVTANFTGSRADVVICDDVEVPRTSDTELKRDDLRTRLAEIDYVLTPGGQQLYIGTPHSFYSIYAEVPRQDTGEPAPFLADFERLVIPIQDTAGTPAWPERFPAAQIAAVRDRTGPNKFASQMLLEPVDITEARLDPARLRRYTHDLVYSEANQAARLSLGGRQLLSAACWWDPAFGLPERGDRSVVAVVFTCIQGEHWLHDIAYLTHDPEAAADLNAPGGSPGGAPGDTPSDAPGPPMDEAAQLCRQVAAFARRNFVPAVIVETNGIGKFLPTPLRQALRDAGVAAAVREEISRHPKDARILEAFDLPLMSRRLHAHARIWETPFIAEMRDWRHGRQGRARGYDDGLDAVAGCLLAQPDRLPRYTRLKRPFADWRPGGADAAPDAGRDPATGVANGHPGPDTFRADDRFRP